MSNAMLDIPGREDIRSLMEPGEGLHISLFLPMERAGKETRQNPIRLKNMLRTAEQKLADHGLRSTDVQKLLQPVSALLDDNLFWQHQDNGLAVFCKPDMMHLYRLPLDFEELVVVAERFHLKPILPLFTGNGHFFILALSQNDVRLLRGTRHTVDEIELPEDTPRSKSEALAYDDTERQLQMHTAGSIQKTGGAQGAGTPLYHGHEDTNARADILRYFLEVDRGVQQVLKGEEAPLVLAGVEELFPFYRDRNSYAHLIEGGVTGNPDTLKAETLHAEAWKVVEPYMQQAQQMAVEQYYAYSASGRASSDIHDVVAAAAYGRVAHLFAAVGVQQWGRFDPMENVVELHEEAQPGDEDLLDLASLHTITNSGTVYAVNQDEVPGGDTLAAVFRY